MPFNPINKTAGDLIRSQDWNSAMAAIAALFDKLDASTGHKHSGSPEDAPQIDGAGIANTAITLQHLANLAVSTAKLQDKSVTTAKLAKFAVDNGKILNGAITGSKIASNTITAVHLATNSVGSSEIASSAVGNSEIATGAVSSSKLGSGAVSNSRLGTNSVSTVKIQNNAVTSAKIASGVLPQIGVAISIVSNGQTAAKPSGFTNSECKFLCSLKTLQFSNPSGTTSVNATINSSGVVTISKSTNVINAFATVMAIGRKGGWLAVL